MDDQDEFRKQLEGNKPKSDEVDDVDELEEVKEPDQKATIQVTVSADLVDEIAAEMRDYFQDFHAIDWVKIEVK